MRRVAELGSLGRLARLVKIPLIKLVVFVALLGGFYAFDGFERPVVSQEDYRSSPRMARAWLITVIMFIAGAVLAVWGNDIAQMVDWDIPDGLYPIIGVLLLLGGFVWMLMVRDSTRRPNHALQRTAASHHCCNRRASWPPSLSLGR